MDLNFFLLFFITVLVIFLFTSSISEIYGHGVGSEIFPPVELNGKQVSLEVSSFQNTSNENSDQQITISLIDFDSKITLRDVAFLIKSSRGEQFLFEKEFQSKNGYLIFNFISDNTETIQVQEETDNGFFGSLLGLENRRINVRGPHLNEGGLYKFDITIITIDDYSKKLDKPLIYNAGISIPQKINHKINDPNFGVQNIQTITYYDEINNFKYDSKYKEITFSMPFEWSISNINQTSVVHQELVIPKTFGDLLASEFSIYINEIKLSNDVITIDDFFSDERIIHFIINTKELWNIFNQDPNQNGMNFLIKPNSSKTQLSAVTDNGQFRVLVSYEPENLKSNSKAKINFDIMDIFLKNSPIAVNYDFLVIQNDRIIYQQKGLSSDSKEKHNIAEFTIPKDVTGIIHLDFQNLGDSSLAKTSIPIVINRITYDNNEVSIPSWIKNNAGWWSDNQIDDKTFLQGIEYLIRNQIIVIPQDIQPKSDGNEIPDWIKNNAGWWSDNQIDDKTFLQGLQYLIKQGIIHV